MPGAIIRCLTCGCWQVYFHSFQPISALVWHIMDIWTLQVICVIVVIIVNLNMTLLRHTKLYMIQWITDVLSPLTLALHLTHLSPSFPSDLYSFLLSAPTPCLYFPFLLAFPPRVSLLPLLTFKHHQLYDKFHSFRLGLKRGIAYLLVICLYE